MLVVLCGVFYRSVGSCVVVKVRGVPVFFFSFALF